MLNLKVDIKRMRELCTRKQYIGKQTELDIKSSSIDKSSDREFSSFTKC
jgi:hypothetical protein